MKSFDTNFYKELVKLALPITIQSLLVATLGIADVMMVGALGDESVAAVGLATKMHFVTMLLIFGFGNACNVLISQYVGANQFHKIKQTILLTVITGVVLLLPVVALFGIKPSLWLSAISQDAEVVKLTANFLTITAVMVLIMVVIMVYETALRALGKTTAPLVLAAVSILVNIFLNYALIFGNFGLPALGVAGAAWATLFSRVLHMLLMLAYIYFPKQPVAIYLTDFTTIATSRIWSTYLTFSLPVAFNFVLWGFGSSLYHIIASRMGTEPLAVMSVLAPIENIVISTFMGFSAAASILLGRALGANQFDYAWQLKKFFVRKAVLLAAICGIAMLSAKPLILLPFNDLDPNTLQLVDQTYLVMCLLVWVKIHNMMSMVSVLRAGGDTIWCLKIDIGSMWMLGLPATALAGLYFELPFVIVFLVMFLEEIVKMIGSHWRMYQRKWLRNLTHVVSSKNTELA